MYRLTILLCLTLVYSCNQPTGAPEQLKGGIADSIRDKVPLSPEQLAFHFNIDSTYINGHYQFSGYSIDKLGDSLFIARINCFDGKACTDQLMVVFNRFTLKETDHMLIQIDCELHQAANARNLKFSHLNDTIFTTEEILEDMLYTKTWKISAKGEIELKINKIKSSHTK